jgi:hypothetical protein
MVYRYVKHPRYMGKSLAIQRGRRDKTVGDHEVLKGREWEKYVAQGLLIPDPNDTEEAPKPKDLAKATPARAPEPEPEPDPEPDPEPVEPPTPISDESPASEEEAEEPVFEAAPEPKPDEWSVSKSPAAKVSGVGGKRRRGKGKK